MIALRSLGFYFFFSSAVFIYGIALEKLVVTSVDLKGWFGDFIRSLVTVLAGTVIVWGMSTMLLVPYNLMELMPFFAVMVMVILLQAVQKLWRRLTKKDVAEFSLSFGIILLAVGEGVTFKDTVCIALSSLAAFHLGRVVLRAFRWRTSYSRPAAAYKTGALVFISIAIFMTILFAINVSWLNFEVF